MKGWRPSTWGDEISLEYGKALRGYESASGSVRVFGSNGPVGWTDKALAKGPGVVLGRKGAYRGVQYSEGDFFVIDTAYYVAPKTDLDMRWLYYAIRHHKLGEIDDGSPIPSTTRAAVYVRELAVPPRDVQQKIARVLGAIDKKIDVNRRINQTLEAMAQAIFRSWFVDFDPVKAKIVALTEGRDPLRAAMSAISGKPDAELDALPSEQYAQLAATAALFPDEMEEPESGGIPRGWRAKKFGDFIDRISVGKKFDQKTALVEGMVPILDQGKSGIIGFHNESPGVRASLEKPIVVFANHTCYMRLITFDFSAIQNVLPFVGKDVDTVWAYYATKDAVKFSEYKGHWPDFVLADAVVPRANLTVHFRKILQPLISQMRILELESGKLAVLRDTLLPKLLSGELSVEALAEQAGIA